MADQAPQSLGDEVREGAAGLRTFLGRFMADPRAIGAIAPSSRYLARRMLQEIGWIPGVRVVEFGPGTGPFTKAIQAALPDGGRYLGIERDVGMVEVLHRKFPRLEIVHGSVEGLLAMAQARDLLPIDHVVSGLPFASLPTPVTEAVIHATFESLRPGGTFTTFQYVHSFPLPSAIAFRRRMKDRFGPVFRWTGEARNLPPALVLTWRKPEAGG